MGKKLPLIALSAVLLSLVIHTIANPDIWFHLALGQKILFTGQFQPPESVLSVSSNFINFYWLFQLAVSISARVFGLFGVTALFGILWFGIFALWSEVAEIDLKKPSHFILTLSAIVICQIRFQERPEVFSYLFLIVDLYLLKRWRLNDKLGRPLISLGIIQILWANSHGYFFLGPAFAALKAASLALEEKSWKRDAHFAVVPLGLVLVSFISPFGWKNWAAVFDQWVFLKESANLFTETQATWNFGVSMWNLDVFWGLWIFTLGLTLLQFQDWKEHRFALGTALVGIVSSATQARNIPFLILMGAPLYALSLASKSKFNRKARERALVFLSVAALGLVIWVAIQGYDKSLFQPTRFGIGVSELIFPVKLEKFLSENHLPKNSKWFCDGTYGSYLEFIQPQFYPLTDSRFAGEGGLEFLAAVTNPTEFQRVNSRYKFEFAIFDVARSVRVVSTLLRDSSWKMIYGDLSTALFENLEIGERKTIPTSKTASLFQGEDLSERILGNDAIQWTIALAGADQLEGLLSYLNQLDQAKVVPAPVFEAVLAYIKVRPDGELISKLMILRPKMLALDNEEANQVDQKLASVKAGSYWN